MMTDLQNIKQLISDGEVDRAMSLLDTAIENNPDNDETLYLRGKLHWKRGETRLALNDYNAAIAINPASPAALALDQANEILNFYNTDLYNP